MTHPVARTYAILLKERTPGVIQTRKDYEARRAEARALMLLPHRSQAQTRYLRLIATLLQAYESERFAIPHATPLEVVRHLMEERGMKQADLAKIVGSSGLTSEICNGSRPIGLNLARKLADHFNAPLVLFLGHDAESRRTASKADLALPRDVRDRDDLRAARAGTAEARKKGAVPWRKVRRDLTRR